MNKDANKYLVDIFIELIILDIDYRQPITCLHVLFHSDKYKAYLDDHTVVQPLNHYVYND